MMEGLGFGDGTHGVDKNSAGSEVADGVVEEEALVLDALVEVAGGGAPTGVGRAGPGAGAGAGGVDENALVGWGWRRGGTGVGLGGGPGGQSGPVEAAAELIEGGGAEVGGVDVAATLHEVAEVEGFSAGACAGIPPSLAGLGMANVGDGLGGDVVGLEGGAEGFLKGGKVLGGRKGIGEGETGMLGGRNTEVLKAGEKVGAGGADPGGRADLEGGVEGEGVDV